MGAVVSCIKTVQRRGVSCCREDPWEYERMFIDDFETKPIIDNSITACPKCHIRTELHTNDGENNYYCPTCGCLFHSCSKVKFERNGSVYCRWCQYDTGVSLGADYMSDSLKCPQCGSVGFHILSTDGSPIICLNPQCKYMWNQSLYYSVTSGGSLYDE